MTRAGVRARGRLDSWPSGHVGWVYSGVSRFESGATTFLAAGAARGERQMFVADDPVVEQWPKHLVDRRALVIASVTEIYGDTRMVVPTSQRDTFAAALAEALSEGYTGIRVAADNSSLVDTPDRLQRGSDGKRSRSASSRRIPSRGCVPSIGHESSPPRLPLCAALIGSRCPTSDRA